MKFQTLPVKRKPVSQGVMRRLSAVTRGRKQRVAAGATAADMEADDGTSKISRNLTIIFLIHIVALGLIFIHQRFLQSRPSGGSVAEAVAPANPAAPAATVVEASAAASADAGPAASTASVPARDTRPYIARDGDTYTSIAAAFGIDEVVLREANGGKAVRAKQIVLIPSPAAAAESASAEPPAATTATTAATATATTEHTATTSRAGVNDDGLVAAIDISQAPKARPVAAAPAAVAAAGTTYLVKPGDSVWGIASRFKIDQDALMRANKLADARKLRAGMKLVIPQG
jgi:LysM repeat protein